MTDVDRQIARSSEVLDRTRDRAVERRKRRDATILKRLGLITAADLTIIVAAVVIGWIVPLGMGGAVLLMALLAAVTILLSVIRLDTAPVATAKLAQTPLAALPATTERWLEAQRPALPAPAVTLADAIGIKLDLLTPQLATLDAASPQAQELRSLIAEQLPGLVDGYARVPRSLRQVERAGTTPDAQVVEGLRVIDRELAELSQQLAAGDMDALATRGRFLESKYRD